VASAISKRGERTIRRLLILGASAVIRQADLDVRYGSRDGAAYAEFSWEGFNDGTAEGLAAAGADLACAASGGRVHPVFGLWPGTVA
jgi:hypothetical protein